MKALYSIENSLKYRSFQFKEDFVTKFFVYLLVVGACLSFLSWWGRRHQAGEGPSPKSSKPFRAKRNPGEIWVQVYETASADEGRMLQARLQEDELECVLYEQGRKDIHGNSLKGIGIAVPKTLASHAQRIISRLLS